MSLHYQSYRDRAEAGRELAAALVKLQLRDPVVLALPRGGVPVGYEVAKRFRAPLDLVFVRKIGAPDHPELGIGAVVDGAHPQVVLNENLVAQLEISSAYIADETRRELREIERRRKSYVGGRRPIDIEGRTGILVDDGIATGGTVRAALQGLARARPGYLVLAVPVAPHDTVERLRNQADEVVCLMMPEPFYAVGAHYEDFRQTSDEEVIALLDQARSWAEETARDEHGARRGGSSSSPPGRA